MSEPFELSKLHNDILEELEAGPKTASEVVICLQSLHTIGAVHEAIYSLATAPPESLTSTHFNLANDHFDQGRRGSILANARVLLEKAGFVSKKDPIVGPWIELAPEPPEQELLARLHPDHIPRQWQLTSRGREQLQMERLIKSAETDSEIK